MFDKITIKKKSGVYVLPLENIIYMEKDLRKVKVYTQIKEFECIDFYSKFENIYSSLDERFLCCHRSYIINMDKILGINESFILLEENHKVLEKNEVNIFLFDLRFFLTTRPN